MKKIIFLFVILLITGCSLSEVNNTPKKQVEGFFSKYQSLDSTVLEQLEDTVKEEESFNDKQREAYISLMKKHYQSLTYDIKDEVINGDKATVTTEIEVTDYSKAMEEADIYLTNNPSEFNKDGVYQASLFTTYRLELLKGVKDIVKYTLEIALTKIDDKWRIDDLSSDDELKIHGMYNY